MQYYNPMKSKSNSSPEYRNFTKALGKVLQVSHSELQERIAEEKKAKASKPRPSSSDRASSDKD
jgi:hypothetical protein